MSIKTHAPPPYNVVITDVDFLHAISNALPMSFLGLLSSIKGTRSGCWLGVTGLSLDANSNPPKIIEYCMRLDCSSPTTVASAERCVSKIASFFEIDASLTQTNDSIRKIFELKDIYLSRLCFVHFVACSSSSRIGANELCYIDAFPMTFEAVGIEQSPVNALQGILQNIIELDRNVSSPFKNDNVGDGAGLQRLLYEHADSFANSQMHPLFAGPAVHEQFESQDAFSSQVRAPKGVYSLSTRRKQQTNIRLPLNAQASLTSNRTSILNNQVAEDVDILPMVLGTEKSVIGTFVAVFPNAFSNLQSIAYCSVKLYFLPANTHTKILKPNINCYEIVVRSLIEFQQLFGVLTDDSERLKQMLCMNKRCEINITAEFYFPTTHNNMDDPIVWCLKSIHSIIEEASTNNDTRSRDEPVVEPLLKRQKMVSVEPTTIPDILHDEYDDELITLSELPQQVDTPNFYTIYAMPIWMSYERMPSAAHKQLKRSYVMITFTDFTTTAIPQKYLYDHYLTDKKYQLHPNEGFRTNIFVKEYSAFALECKNVLDVDIDKTTTKGITYNVSEYGIVCKLYIKAKMYDGKLNIVIQNAEPITIRDYTGMRLGSKNRTYLKRFYERAERRFTQLDLDLEPNGYTKIFSKSFPLKEKEHTEQSNESIEQDDESMGQGDEHLQTIVGTILGVEQFHNFVVLILKRADYNAMHFSKCTTLCIYGNDDIEQFNEGRNNGITEMNTLLQCAFKFNVNKLRIQLDDVSMELETPVECTFTELKQQTKMGQV